MRIERRSYSRNPWRLVSSDGREITTTVIIDHPEIGQTSISESVAGATRRECEAKALALLEDFILDRARRRAA